jgi:hypothetical protein
MTDFPSNLMKELVAALESAAMYNDKGHVWMGHCPDKRAAMEAEFHENLLRLMAQIGPENLEPALVRAISSGAAARDEFGSYLAIAKASVNNV